MSDFPLEELENLIPTLIEETRRLKELNQRLQNECDSLNARVEQQDEVTVQLDEARERIRNLETRQEKLETERVELRSRLQRLYDEMENVDFL